MIKMTNLEKEIIRLWDTGDYTAITIAEHFDIRLNDVIDILFTKYPDLRIGE
jgi:hypothetical protein